MKKMCVFAETCVQDVVSLFGSQEEREFGSAARHLPGFRKVGRQWPNGEELGEHQRRAPLLSYCTCGPDPPVLISSLFLTESQGVSRQRGSAGRCATHPLHPSCNQLHNQCCSLRLFLLTQRDLAGCRGDANWLRTLFSADMKSKMSLVVSVHVYSVQKAALKDSGPLYSVDYDAVKDNLKDCSRFADLCHPHILLNSF